jgi:hypothetical protein
LDDVGILGVKSGVRGLTTGPFRVNVGAYLRHHSGESYA